MLLDAGVRLRKRQLEPMVDAWRHNGVDTATDQAGVVTCPKQLRWTYEQQGCGWCRRCAEATRPWSAFGMSATTQSIMVLALPTRGLKPSQVSV